MSISKISENSTSDEGNATHSHSTPARAGATPMMGVTVVRIRGIAIVVEK